MTLMTAFALSALTRRRKSLPGEEGSSVIGVTRQTDDRSPIKRKTYDAASHFVPLAHNVQEPERTGVELRLLAIAVGLNSELQSKKCCRMKRTEILDPSRCRTARKVAEAMRRAIGCRNCRSWATRADDRLCDACRKKQTGGPSQPPQPPGRAA